jgi:hypothetical protein
MSSPGTSQAVSRSVRQAMATWGMTQQQLADELGWTLGKLNVKLAGRTAWTVDELHELADVLGVCPAVVLGGQPGELVQARAVGCCPRHAARGRVVKLPHLDSNQEPTGFGARGMPAVA